MTLLRFSIIIFRYISVGRTVFTFTYISPGARFIIAFVCMHNAFTQKRLIRKNITNNIEPVDVRDADKPNKCPWFWGGPCVDNSYIGDC